jgi:serine/threonine-protein kinase
MSVGSKLGRYELLARIATGGMGEIFLARLAGAAGFEKLCVVKRILPHLADDKRFRAMLISEARIASSMSHANICHVYELDEISHQLYLVMEYLEGVTLLQLLASVSTCGEQLDLGFIAGVIQQTCEGLHYAHELCDRHGNPLGVVHRDVTPSNLFLTQSGVVKIVDFGVAKAQGSAESQSGAVKGKYAYMAPEQLRGQPIDRRVDVFSFAVVVFEMLTCRRLYQRKTDYLTFRAVMEVPQLDLQRYRLDAPEAVEPVLRSALSRDPGARYATVRQLGAALLEAFGTTRPWGQADISELVRTTFSDKIRLTNAEISRVVRKPHEGSDVEIPVIMLPTAELDESDYQSIETDGDHPPAAPEGFVFGRRSGALGDPMSDGMRPAEPVSAPVSLPVRPVAPGSRRRGLRPPMLAIVGGAGALLVLGLVVIGNHAHRGTPARTSPAAGAPPSPDITGRADQARVEHHHPRPSGPYGAAISSYERELDQCAREHGEAFPADARALIVVGVDGRAKQVVLQPPSVDQSALGDCIRKVFALVLFPSAPDEKRVALGLALHR